MPAVMNSNAATGAVTWNAEKFALFNRPDSQLVLSGAGTLALENKTVKLAGRSRPSADTSSCRRIVPTRWATMSSSAAASVCEAMSARSASLSRSTSISTSAISSSFVGQGFNSGLAGKLHVKTTAGNQLVADGTINAVRGTYTAFGQRLAIERGRLYFNGPLDNPGLDVLALRKNLAVEAGVEVTGTVQVPLVRLTSTPSGSG